MASGQTRQQKRRKPDEWRALLARYDDSGLSVKAFCQQESISEASFFRWRGSLASGETGTQQTLKAATFVELGPLSAPPATGGHFEIRLDLGSGVVMHLVRG